MCSSKCILWILLNTLILSLCKHEFSTFDNTKYEEGRTRYELLDANSKLPMYGQCWKDAIMTIKFGCKELTDIVQSRLALSYLNCFLGAHGRDIYSCESEEPVHECTKSMTNTDMGTFATFFTETHNICYFLEAQVWQQETEQTISRLARHSANMAEFLEESGDLQQAMLIQQNLTLKNQDNILYKATNLSSVISTASANVFELYSLFEKTTTDQRHLINDIFDKIVKLQSTVLGGFSRFYSLIYYTLSIILCWLLTSARRTAGARFWLLIIVTISTVAERLILAYFTVTTADKVEEAEIEETIYTYQWLCRQVSAIISIFVLIFFIYIYRNMHVINNQLLLKLKKQNSELKYQVKELHKEMSLIRHFIMNQPVTDSDDSDDESTTRVPAFLKRQKKPMIQHTGVSPVIAVPEVQRGDDGSAAVPGQTGRAPAQEDPSVDTGAPSTGTTAISAGPTGDPPTGANDTEEQSAVGTEPLPTPTTSERTPRYSLRSRPETTDSGSPST